jgi:hypothetical protein
MRPFLPARLAEINRQANNAMKITRSTIDSSTNPQLSRQIRAFLTIRHGL